MQNRSLTSTLDRMMTLNRAFDQAFSSTMPNGTSLAAHAWVPALDVIEKADAYEVSAELAGVDPAKVELTFDHNVLTIRGTKTASVSTPTKEIRVYAAERVSGSFERTIRLPEFVDGDRIAATFVNGLLTVNVPKAKGAQARKIEIGVAA